MDIFIGYDDDYRCKDSAKLENYFRLLTDSPLKSKINIMTIKRCAASITCGALITLHRPLGRRLPVLTDLVQICFFALHMIRHFLAATL